MQVLVCPDVGCGVFANDPQVLGTMLGQVLREPKMGKLEVLLTGQVAFADAVQKAVSGQQVELTPAPAAYFSQVYGKSGTQRLLDLFLLRSYHSKGGRNWKGAALGPFLLFPEKEFSKGPRAHGGGHAREARGELPDGWRHDGRGGRRAGGCHRGGRASGRSGGCGRAKRGARRHVSGAFAGSKATGKRLTKRSKRFKEILKGAK